MTDQQNITREESENALEAVQAVTKESVGTRTASTLKEKTLLEQCFDIDLKIIKPRICLKLTLGW